MKGGAQHTPASPMAGSAFIMMVLAGLAIWGSYQLYAVNLRGHPWTGYLSLAGGFISLKLLWTMLRAHEENRRQAWARRQFKAVNKTDGRSRWGTAKDTKQAGMADEGGHFIGAHGKKDRFFTAEGSGVIIAKPGSGKFTTSLCPNLIKNHTDAAGRAVSIVVLDFKHEAYVTTHKYMESIGYETICVSAWSGLMSEALGVEIRDTGYNPLLPLATAGETTKDLAEQLAALLLPIGPRSSDSSSFFVNSGRVILVFAMLRLTHQSDPAKINLVEVRKLLMSPVEQFEETLAKSSVSDAFNGALAEYANKIIQTKLDAPEEYSGGMSTATTMALQIYDAFGPLGRHISTTGGFMPERIKDKPTIAYIGMPAEYVASHEAYLRLTLGTCIERMAMDRTNRRVRLYLDEFANAGYLPNILKSLGLYRQQGLQFFFYLQTISQITRIYGEEGLQDLLGMVDLIQAYGVSDMKTCKLLSELTGQDTIKEFSQTMQPDMGTGNKMGFSMAASSRGRPLIRPEDIRTMPANKQLVITGNMPPLMMDKVSYLERPAWKKRAADNPYYTRKKTK